MRKRSGIVACIEECNLKNCVTNHESEKIIKEYIQIQGFLIDRLR